MMISCLTTDYLELAEAVDRRSFLKTAAGAVGAMSGNLGASLSAGAKALKLSQPELIGIINRVVSGLFNGAPLSSYSRVENTIASGGNPNDNSVVNLVVNVITGKHPGTGDLSPSIPIPKTLFARAILGRISNNLPTMIDLTATKECLKNITDMDGGATTSYLSNFFSDRQNIKKGFAAYFESVMKGDQEEVRSGFFGADKRSEIDLWPMFLTKDGKRWKKMEKSTWR